MNRVKIFLEDIIDKKLKNAEEARIWYLSNIYDQEKKIRGIDNKNNRNIDMLNLYDSVKKNFITPSYDKTDDEQPDATDIPELETEESTDQEGQGLKILSPEQMLSRLPILLAQLQAANNSQIKQMLYLLYRPKKLS